MDDPLPAARASQHAGVIGDSRGTGPRELEHHAGGGAGRKPIADVNSNKGRAGWRCATGLARRIRQCRVAAEIVDGKRYRARNEAAARVTNCDILQESADTE